MFTARRRRRKKKKTIRRRRLEASQASQDLRLFVWFTTAPPRVLSHAPLPSPRDVARLYSAPNIKLRMEGMNCKSMGRQTSYRSQVISQINVQLPRRLQGSRHLASSQASGGESGTSIMELLQTLALKEWAPTCAALGAGDQTVSTRRTYPWTCGSTTH
jgi:hypothetical protein